ncbi:MAG TPA: ribosome maturation factor RimM [Anaerolineales bacterium]|nr:ribosome maturation factor RimM [Anaerolineales bacterium]
MAETKNTGSPAGEPLYLSVGFLRRPHGLHGEIIMDLHTDFPERMKNGRKVFIGENYKPVTFENVRPHAKGLLVKLKGVNTPDEAGLYRNQWVYIKKKDAPALPKGQYYKHELYGLKVIDDRDNPLGELVEIIETGANDVYVVRDGAGKEILLPAIPSVILDLEPGRGFIRVHLLDGLIGG